MYAGWHADTSTDWRSVAGASSVLLVSSALEHVLAVPAQENRMRRLVGPQRHAHGAVWIQQAQDKIRNACLCDQQRAIVVDRNQAAVECPMHRAAKGDAVAQ